MKLATENSAKKPMEQSWSRCGMTQHKAFYQVCLHQWIHLFFHSSLSLPSAFQINMYSPHMLQKAQIVWADLARNQPVIPIFQVSAIYQWLVAHLPWEQESKLYYLFQRIVHSCSQGKCHYVPTAGILLVWNIEIVGWSLVSPKFACPWDVYAHTHLRKNHLGHTVASVHNVDF